MNSHSHKRVLASVVALAVWLMLPTLVMAEGYTHALHEVKSFDAVYDVSTADPVMANIVFWAVKNSYEVPEVGSIGARRIAVVFHGFAVKLLSTDKSLFKTEDLAEVAKFQETLKQMKQSGVTLEVCQYAVKVVGVKEATILPEVDRVGNGFVPVIGYQNQGYAVVRLP